MIHISGLRQPSIESARGLQRGVASPDRYAGRADDRGDVEAALRQLMAGQPPATKEFADSYGRVTHLALMLSDYVQGAARDQVLNAYKTLFLRMEPDTKFTVVAATDQDKADVEQVIRDNNVPNPDRIQILEPGISDLTVWARDMMVPKFYPNDGTHTALMAETPLHNWHLSDSKVPAVIVQATPSIVLDSEPALVTDGGDVQSNTKEAFAGFYSLAATECKMLQALADDPFKADAIKYYETKCGKQVVQTPPESTLPFQFDSGQLEDNPAYQKPDLHDGQVAEADMYRDLAKAMFEQDLGKPVTVMGMDDPATPHHEDPATDHMDMGLTPVDDATFFVGDPALADSLTQHSSRNHNDPQDFDAYAKTLQDKGYRVVRMPEHEPYDGDSPYISYNNCLMERFQKDGKEVRRVFLPTYGIQKTDDYAIKTWQGEGFEVIPVPLSELSKSWGALRCISNWLERFPAG